MSQPQVYVHIPTYARTELLREALESVRRQTYRGEIDVLIHNDCPWQHLEVDDLLDAWPWNINITVINEMKRHPSLGAKRQAMIDETPQGVWIAFLDDDDLWMPTYLEQSIFYAPSADLIISQSVFYHRHDLWTYEDIPGGIPMLVRSDWARAAGFPLDCSCGEDNVFRKRLGDLPQICSVRNRRPGYCVRAGGGHLHASMANDTKFMLNAEAQRERGKEPQGYLTVRPAWREDYEKVLRTQFPEAFQAGG